MTTLHSAPWHPAMDPPSSALPQIPAIKPPRKSLPVLTESSKIDIYPHRDLLASTGTRPLLQTGAEQSSSSPAVPALRSSSSIGQAPPLIKHKTLRKAISISSFPQPPKTGPLPSAAFSTSSMISSGKSASGARDSMSSVGGGQSKLPSKVSATAGIATAGIGSNSRSQTPSLLTGGGDGKALSVVDTHRISDGQYSIPSPPQSRSSSAQDSYSTNTTTFEDTDEGRQAREEADSVSGPQTKTLKGNVIVSVRVRPDVQGQDVSQAEGEWMVDSRNSLVAFRGREGGDYFYDNVFATHDNNAKVYDSCAKRLVRRVMEGYHGTVFAYGMTGTGKTFSMQGTATNPGVIPLAITDIFSYIRETPQREFLLRVSYLEIYNEKIYDLLATPSVAGTNLGAGQQEEIKIREDSKRGVYATPLKEEIVQSPTQLLRVIARGDHARRTGSTQYNLRSSRSHAVVQIVVESRKRAILNGPLSESKPDAAQPGGVRVSTLSLIDLAGSERAAESKARRTEGAHINKSLLTLGTVIARLSGDKDRSGNQVEKDGKHLPYRDSKLTRFLQPALSGNSLVSILCTLQIGSLGSAAAGNSHTGETLNTLKFAARAKNNIVSHAKKADEAIGPGGNAGLLERYRNEIQSLRNQLESQQKAAIDKEEKQMEKEVEQRHEEQMLEMQLARTALKERIEHLNRLILCSKSTGVNGADSGNVSALGMHSRLSGNSGDLVLPRSVRSSASQSTLGTPSPSFNLAASTSFTGPAQSLYFTPTSPDEEDAIGDFADGMASLKAQNRALQTDLHDKNRYIATLEKRLLQAKRLSHSRLSGGFSLQPAHGGRDENRVSVLMQEKNSEIAELRTRLKDQERMISALRSAVRKREVAELTPDLFSADYQNSKHQSISSNSSSRNSAASTMNHISPAGLFPPKLTKEKKEKAVDEMSKILDDMIQDKVESGHLVKVQTGSVQVTAYSRPMAGVVVEGGTTTEVPGLRVMIPSQRDFLSGMGIDRQ